MQEISKSDFLARPMEILRQVEELREPVLITDGGPPVFQVSRYLTETDALPAPLPGSVLRYEGPTDPVGEEDWEVLA